MLDKKTSKGAVMENSTLLKNPKIQTARRLRQIFGLVKTPVLKKMTGTQGLTYLMNKKTVVKVPLTDAQTEQLKALAALSALLKHKTPVRTPDLKLYDFVPTFGTDSAEMSADDIGMAAGKAVIGCYPLLKGVVFSSMPDFYDEELSVREKAVYALGSFVADLHSVTPDEIETLKIGTARNYLHGVLFEEFKQETQDVPLSKRARLSDGIYNRIFDGCGSDVLCHMDLHMGNVCFDENFQRLTGVFDFGSAVKGPKELEFMTIAGVYNEELAAFKAGYQNRSRTMADFESVQCRRVCKYLSPFSRWREMPVLIQEEKQRI